MTKDDRELIERIAKYIREYEDAPTWGGPTMYPAAPSVADLRAILALLTRLEALQAQPVIPGDAIENVAREIAIGCNLDPDAISPKTNMAGHEIPEWMFFTAAAQRAIAALTASPPVVEREAIARIIDPREWDEAENYRARADEWFAKGRTKPGDALTDGHRRKADEMKAKLLAKADAILALTPVEVVGERDLLNDIAAMMSEFVDNWPHPRKVSTALKLIAKTMRTALSTPVAQGDEVRDALERIVKRVADGEWADPGHRALMTDARELLATLTKGARDAG